MKEDNRKPMRVNITLYDDANQNIYDLLCQTEKNRSEVVRRLLEFAINQFPKDALSAQNILNGSFYYASHIQPASHTNRMSNDDDGIDKENAGKIASKINF